MVSVENKLCNLNEACHHQDIFHRKCTTSLFSVLGAEKYNHDNLMICGVLTTAKFTVISLFFALTYT